MVWREQNLNAVDTKPITMADDPSSVARSDELDGANSRTFGLVNVGAICWFNSLIQAIMSAPRAVIVIKDESAMMPRDSQDNVLGAFGRFIMDVYADESASAIHNASSILVALMKTVKNFGMMQEDANEGFHLLLDAMPTSVSRMFESSWCIDLYCDHCSAIVSTHAREEMMHLVMMERSIIPLSLNGDPFVQFMSGHMTSVTGYKCPKCSKCNNARESEPTPTKTMRIVRLVKPADILVVSFNKYIEKWHGPEYPINMTVSFKATADSEGGSAQYELISVIRHMGTMHSGHYNALCRHGASVVMVDDASIRDAAWKQCPEDYMLFYARK